MYEDFIIKKDLNTEIEWVVHSQIKYTEFKSSKISLELFSGFVCLLLILLASHLVVDWQMMCRIAGDPKKRDVD